MAAMRDACAQHMSDKRLIHYFAMLLLHAAPSDPQRMLELFLDALNPQLCPINVQPKSVEIRISEVLRILEYFLRGMGSSCR